jgi:hypothetical protein
MWLPLRHVFHRDNSQAAASVNSHNPTPDTGSAQLDFAGVVDTPVANTIHSDSGSNCDALAGTTNVDTNNDQHGHEASLTEQNGTLGDNNISSDDQWAVQPVVTMVSGIICRVFYPTDPMLQSSQLIQKHVLSLNINLPSPTQRLLRRRERNVVRKLALMTNGLYNLL